MIIFLQKQMHIACCNAIDKHHYFRKECLSLPWSCDPVSLSFLHSITSPLFPNNGINDVIEASDGEVTFQFGSFSVLRQQIFLMTYAMFLKGVCDPMATILRSCPGQLQPPNCPRKAPGPSPIKFSENSHTNFHPNFHQIAIKTPI